MKAGLVPGLTEIEECRVCEGRDFETVLDLGVHYLHRITKPKDKHPEYKAPLVLILCVNCKLLQLKHTVPPDYLFREYFYESSVNATMRAALADVVKQVESRVDLSYGGHVVDIGSNDSTLLKSYTQPVTKVGFEPARNLMIKAKFPEAIIINDYFSAEAYFARVDKLAKVVTATAVFYDTNEPVKFISDIGQILSDDGIAILQMNYMPLMLWQNAFDNIVHEHIIHFALTQIETICRLAVPKLYINSVDLNDVNGGSIRIFLSKNPIEDGSVEAIRNLERIMKLDDLRVYQEFSRRIERIKQELGKIILPAVAKGKKVYAYGASTRGSTTLQYCELDHRLITAIAERNPSKWRKRTSGTHIPIISEEQMRKERPDYLLILPWQFLPEFLQREEEYCKGGGKFIVPLPWPKVIP